MPRLCRLALVALGSASGFVRPALLVASPHRARPAIAQQPLSNAYGDAAYPPNQGGAPYNQGGGWAPRSNNGAIVSAFGLMATLFVSASALSMTGTLATIAASFAGLFSFKLAKELTARGVNKKTFSNMATGAAMSSVKLGVRTTVSIGIAAAYALASVVSMVVWILISWSLQPHCLM